MTGATDLNVDVHISRGTFTLVARQHFPPGTVTAIIGSNGAGKTTLLEGIAGFLTLNQGHITQGDQILADHSQRISLPPFRRSIALLGQKAQLFPHMSVADNIAFGPRVQKAGAGEIKARTSLWANRLNLEGVLERLPRELSGGQQQRVALARALASRPTTLLLDEPTASLDVEAASSFRAALSDELRQEPVTTLLVTHAIEDVIGLADHLVVLENGAITASGPAREQLMKPATTFVANFAGLNRLAGTASGSVMLVDGIPLTGAQAPPPGATLVAIPPEAVLFNQPALLCGNTWDTTVTAIHAKRLGFAIECASPRGLVGYADLTEMARLDLQVGSRVTVSIDPGQITAY